MGKQLRILFIVPRFGTINRGVETFVLELVSRLDPGRFDITVLSAPHDVIVPDVTFQQVPLLERERMTWLDRVPELCRCLRPLGLGSASDLETLSLLRRCGGLWPAGAFDVIVPLGGTWSYRFARRKFRAAHVVSIGQAGPVSQDLRLSDVFIALTPYDESRARNLCPGMVTRVIPNGVDLVRFSPLTSPPSRDHRSTRTVLCAAALVPDKRHDLLFDAVMRLPDYVRVKCVGAGPHRAVLEQHPLVKAGRVEFCQHPFSEMPEVYRGADVFSLASPDEAFGIVFVEALASGLPVVANDGPRQQFVVNGGGVLCDVHSADVYAESIKSMLDAAPSSKAREHAMAFDWRRIAAAYDELFSSLMARSL